MQYYKGGRYYKNDYDNIISKHCYKNSVYYIIIFVNILLNNKNKTVKQFNIIIFNYYFSQN